MDIYLEHCQQEQIFHRAYGFSDISTWRAIFFTRIVILAAVNRDVLGKNRCKLARLYLWHCIEAVLAFKNGNGLFWAFASE